MEKYVKRLEVVCRRVKEIANDFVKAPTKKKLLNKLRARVYKSVLVEQSFKLAFAPFGYTFCKYMTEKGAGLVPKLTLSSRQSCEMCCNDS